MERSLVVFLVSLLTAFLVDAQPRDNEQVLDGPRGLKVFVGQKGAGMRLYRELPPHPGKQQPRRTGQIEISLGRIRESNGTDEEMPRPPPGPQPGPRPGPRRHDFEPGDVDFNTTKEMHKNLQPRGGGGADIQGDCLILSKPVKQVNDTVLTVTICVIKENGSLTIDDEDTEVSDGQLKFSIELEDWPWSDDGLYLDVDVIVKLPNKRQVKEKDRGGHTGGRKRPVAFSLGENALIIFSKKVGVDGTFEDMPGGFPSPPKERDSHYVITLRFPRFNNTIFYDPIMDVLQEQPPPPDVAPPGDDGKAIRAAVVPLCAGLLLGLAASKLAF